MHLSKPAYRQPMQPPSIENLKHNKMMRRHHLLVDSVSISGTLTENVMLGIVVWVLTVNRCKTATHTKTMLSKHYY